MLPQTASAIFAALSQPQTGVRISLADLEKARSSSEFAKLRAALLDEVGPHA